MIELNSISLEPVQPSERPQLNRSLSREYILSPSQNKGDITKIAV